MMLVIRFIHLDRYRTTHTTTPLMRHLILLTLSVLVLIVAVAGGPGHHHHHHKPGHGQMVPGIGEKRNLLKIEPTHPARVKGKYQTPSVSGSSLYKELFQGTEKEIFSRWKVTTGKEFGRWEVDATPAPVGLPGDTSLIAKLTDSTEGEHFGIYTLFDKPIVSSEAETLVIQYEARFPREFCAGAYMKLLSASEDPIASNTTFQVGPSTPYVIMFGPDRCAPVTDKVQFIFRHLNPLTKKYEEKHLINPPQAAGMRDNRMHHYALHIHKDNTFEIYVDTEKVRSGSLLTDFDPPVNPPKAIDDPEHKKPASWDDRKEIPDPFAVQPENWNPDDLVHRTCLEAKTQESKKKGPWVPPMIPNPKYAGPFPKRQIPNPDYYEDLHPNHFAPIGGIAFEILAHSYYVAFDNIVITTSKAMGKEYALKTWKPRYDAELEAEQQERLKIVEAEQKAADEARKRKAEREAKKNAPKTEEERWQRRETELNRRWENGEVNAETLQLTAQFVLYKYRTWGTVALRWIERNPGTFFAGLAGLLVLRYALKAFRTCLNDRRKKKKAQQKKAKAEAQKKKAQ